MKRLIVNADDFGMAGPVNDGIIKGHKEGIITSTSFMAGGAASEHAARLAIENPSLGVGVHLCLTLIKPVAGPATLPTLASEGLLPGGPFPLMSRLMLGAIKKDEIERELRAQIERTLALGIKPDHIDGHQHVHVLPGVFNIALKLAKEYKIPAMRYPVGPLVNKAGRFKRLEKFILEDIARSGRRDIEAAGIKTPLYFFGMVETGILSRDMLMNILNHLPDGTSELMCHPGLPSDTRAENNWGKGWGAELEAVTDEEVKNRVMENKINLDSFNAL